MKVFIAIIMILILLVAFAGCGSPEAGSPSGVAESAPQSTISMSPTVTPDSTYPAAPLASSATTPSTSEPVSYISGSIQIRYFDVHQNVKKSDVYTIKGTPDINTAFEAVNELYIKKVLNINDVKTNSILYSEGNIFIDFPKSVYHPNINEQSEASMLACIADAYLSNIQGAKAVYFSVEGGPYTSGNIVLPKDKPYAVK